MKNYHSNLYSNNNNEQDSYYRKDKYFTRDDSNNITKKRSHFLLPPPAILEAYEQMSPGSVAKIIEMAEIEQKHRHKWEDQALKTHVNSNRMSMLSGALVALVITLASLYLALHGEHKIAFSISTFGFMSLFISSIISYFIGQKIERKPRKMREILAVNKSWQQ